MELRLYKFDRYRINRVCSEQSYMLTSNTTQIYSGFYNKMWTVKHSGLVFWPTMYIFARVALSFKGLHLRLH